MTAKDHDPTKDPKFQKVVQTFLQTKPQPHKAPSSKRAKPQRRGKPAKTKG